MSDTIFNELAVEITDIKKTDSSSHRYWWCILLLSWAHCREGVRNSMNGLVHGLHSNQAKKGGILALTGTVQSFFPKYLELPNSMVLRGD